MLTHSNPNTANSGICCFFIPLNNRKIDWQAAYFISNGMQCLSNISQKATIIYFCTLLCMVGRTAVQMRVFLNTEKNDKELQNRFTLPLTLFFTPTLTLAPIINPTITQTSTLTLAILCNSLLKLPGYWSLLIPSKVVCFFVSVFSRTVLMQINGYLLK